MPGSADSCFITETKIEDIREVWEGKGVTVEEGPVVRTGTLGAMRSVYFRDPDGNLIEVSCYELK